jgi:hypothetical protein
MLAEYGDLWDLPCDARCLTVNGYVKTNGEAVMGRGVALQAKQRWPELPRILGVNIQIFGNHVFDLWQPPNEPLFISFPVKAHWREQADLELIKRSCRELMAVADRLELEHIILPKPGCGNGRLSWDIVRPAISPLLDDRVSVLYYDPPGAIQRKLLDF